MAWYDYYKLFTYAFTQDPYAKKKDTRNLSGAGTSQPDVLPDLRNADGYSAGANAFIRIQNDLVDLTTTTNRQNRYKEYERLVASCPEIEMAMTVFADEACIAGDTEISTVFHGPQSIEWLTKHKANERFPVYCYDFDKEDYTIGWAYEPRLVKRAPTVRICLDNGTWETVTHDHRILLRTGHWIMAGQLKPGDELMLFYRVKANQAQTKLRHHQFPRIWTHNKGWIHERQFIDEWRVGKPIEQYERPNLAVNTIAKGNTIRETCKEIGHEWLTIENWIKKEGFSYKEARYLGKQPDRRRVIGVHPGPEIDVYDLSVENHKNFCTKNLIMHNCQKDEDCRVFKIECKNTEVVDELKFLFFHRNMLNMDQRNCWDKFKRLCIKGDAMWELVINPDNPKEGVYKLTDLPPESMYRIETTKGKLLEFQQGKEGPDYNALQKAPIVSATETELMQATAVRFAPEQVVHLRIGDYRKTFYPYGVSLIEAARGPAHQLRMMEDAMVVYRLCLVGDTRIRTWDGYKHMRDLVVGDTVFAYTPHGPLPTKVEAFINNGVQDVYCVRSKHIEITGTKTHPILVNRDGVIQYVDIQDLIPHKDKLIPVPDNHGTFEYEIPIIVEEPWAKLTNEQRKIFIGRQYKNKSDLLRKCHNFGRAKQFLYRKGKALPLDKAKKICEIFGLDSSHLLIVDKNQRNSERVNLPEYVTEEFAKLFGFLCGDGNIHNDSQLSFSTGDNEEVNEYYRRLLEKFFGKVCFESDKRSRKGLGKYTVNSTAACGLLTKMGYINDHNTNRIPDWVLTSPINIRRAFVEGLSDADGCERHTDKGTWYSTIELSNKRLAEDIKEVWSSIGLCSGHIKERKREGGHEIEPGRIMPPTTSYSVTISDLLLPETENVLEVKYVGQEEVFDITVDREEHNFIANSIPVHNTRAPERRVFYIDVGQLPPFKAEAFMERMKDQFRKKKVVSGKGGSGGGASAVEERWHAPAQDEDYWIPIRPNSATKIDTLPGAENLGEIDDTVYFRNKLFTALNFPKNYFSLEDPNATRITLSAQDVKFARMIERLQSHFEDALWEVADRHLKLRGFPSDSYEDLTIKMTPPSDWRELSRAEVVTNRINNANGLKGSQLMSDFDILTKWMKYSEDEANEMISRMKIQKLEDLKLQVLAQNPQLLGVGIPGQGETEMGAEPGGPNPMLPPGQPPGGDVPPPGGEAPPGGEPPAPGGAPVPGGPPMPPPPSGRAAMMPPATQAQPLPDPSDEEIMQYDLEIQDYDADQDVEDIDYSEVQ